MGVLLLNPRWNEWETLPKEHDNKNIKRPPLPDPKTMGYEMACNKGDAKGPTGGEGVGGQPQPAGRWLFGAPEWSRPAWNNGRRYHRGALRQDIGLAGHSPRFRNR